MKPRLVRFVAVLFLVFLVPALRAQESDAQATNPSMKELIDEIRMLRISFQHATLSAYRGQLMIERLRLQQETVSRLEAALERVRSEQGSVRSQIDQIEDYARQMEEHSSGEFDPERLRVVENEKRVITQRLESFEKRLQQLALEESEKAVDLERERELVEEVRHRLDEIDRDIERQIEEGKN